MSAKKRNATAMAIFPVVKACAAAIAITIILILLLALALKAGILEYGAVPIANQVVKVLGIFLAALFATRSTCEKPWLRGLLAGVIYIILGFIVFSIVAGAFTPSISLLLDLAMGAIVGVLTSLVLGRKKAVKAGK